MGRGGGKGICAGEPILSLCDKNAVQGMPYLVQSCLLLLVAKPVACFEFFFRILAKA